MDEYSEALTDSTGIVIGIDVDPVDASAAAQSQGVVILQKLPLAVNLGVLGMPYRVARRA